MSASAAASATLVAMPPVTSCAAAVRHTSPEVIPTIQGVTLVHLSAQRKHLLMDTVGNLRASVAQNGSG